jgi:hypothetical protein
VSERDNQQPTRRPKRSDRLPASTGPTRVPVDLGSKIQSAVKRFRNRSHYDQLVGRGTRDLLSGVHVG